MKFIFKLCTLALGFGTILLIGLIGYSILSGRSLAEILLPDLPTPSEVLQEVKPEVEIIPEIRSVTLEEIRSISELSTSEFIMETIVPVTSERKIGRLTLNTSNLLYISRGKVKAGIDFNKVSDGFASIDGTSVTVLLPYPEVLDSYIDVEKSKVYDYDRGFLNLGPNSGIEMQNKAQADSLNEIVKTACNENILEDSKEKASTLIESIYKSAGFDKVEITFSEPIKCGN